MHDAPVIAAPRGLCVAVCYRGAVLSSPRPTERINQDAAITIHTDELTFVLLLPLHASKSLHPSSPLYLPPSILLYLSPYKYSPPSPPLFIFSSTLLSFSYFFFNSLHSCPLFPLSVSCLYNASFLLFLSSSLPPSSFLVIFPRIDSIFLSSFYSYMHFIALYTPNVCPLLSFILFSYYIFN